MYTVTSNDPIAPQPAHANSCFFRQHNKSTIKVKKYRNETSKADGLRDLTIKVTMKPWPFSVFLSTVFQQPTTKIIWLYVNYSTSPIVDI